MDTLRQPNRAKYANKNKTNTPFEEWWGMVLKCYAEGFLDCPAIGKNPDYPFEWWVPTPEQIEKFRTDENVKSMYAKSCYDAGEDPGSALDSMD